VRGFSLSVATSLASNSLDTFQSVMRKRYFFLPKGRR